jgi:hypothetical protein
MLRRRPVLRNAGVVACTAVLGTALVLASAGCRPGTVEIDRPELAGRSEEACSRLVEELPDSVGDQDRRPVTADALGAAWGDPPIVLRCGVGRAAGFDRFATCQETNGVGWFIPEEQITGRATEVLMTTIGRVPRVEVRVPPDYFPPAATMVDLAGPIKGATEEVRPCV